MRTGINAYDEYGVPAAGNAAVSAGGRFGYTGQAWVPELGLWYYKARAYSPILGRFLQVDPVGYDDQINLYAYVGNDPANKADPDGQQSDELMDRRNQAMIQAMDECKGRGAACAAALGEGIGVAALAVSTFVPLEGLFLKALPWMGRAFGMGKLPFSIPRSQFGAKAAQHMRDFGLDVRKAADRATFRRTVESIGTRPDTVVAGTFRGQGVGGAKGSVQFRIKGNDVVVTKPDGTFVSVLKDGINNPSVRDALRNACSGTRIAANCP